MKDLSEVAKLRISSDPDTRSEIMRQLAKRKHKKLTKAQRIAHAVKMGKASQAARRKAKAI